MPPPRATSISLDDVTISIITAHELIVGARNQRDADGIDGLIRIYPMHADLDARITGRAYQLLKRHAKADGLRTFDALIAATAIENGFTLVSKNRKHFQMIGELSLEVPDY
jgi:predicted nucleic acid-binding protein